MTIDNFPMKLQNFLNPTNSKHYSTGIKTIWRVSFTVEKINNNNTTLSGKYQKIDIGLHLNKKG